MVTVVLLPGMDGSGALFEDFASELKAKSIVISYPDDQPLGYGELNEFVLAALPNNEPFILLAESFSGPIAIALAGRHLPLLRAVVLVCSFAQPPLRSPFGARRFRLRPECCLVAFVLQLQKRDSSASCARLRPRVWKARLRAVLAVDSTTSLGRIQVPVLYLRASEDSVVFRSASEVISEHVWGAKIMEIEGPHFLLQAKQ